MLFQKIFQKPGFQRNTITLLAFALCNLFAFQANADFIFQKLETKSSVYHSGKVNTYLFYVDYETNNGAFADYIQFDFPSGWEATTTPGKPLPGNTPCGPIVVSGKNTSQLIFGKDDPVSNPIGNSNCGVIGSGYLSFYIDVYVPNYYNTDQDVSVKIIGDGYGSQSFKEESKTLSLAAVACALTCPEDITVDADPLTCQAFVNIPLPDTIGDTCDPAPMDMSGTYDIGTHTIVFTSGGASCSMVVTVLDTSAPTFGTCEDITDNLDSGECGMVMYYDLGVEESCAATSVTITQSNDPTTVNNSVACPGGQTSNIRVFDLDGMGFTTDIQLSSVQIGVFQAFNSPTVNVRIYELTGALSFDELELVEETSVSMPNLFMQLYDIPITTTLDVQKDYVVEVQTPPSLISGFVMGANSNGETNPSYIYSDFCGLTDIEPVFQSTGFNLQWVMNLQGTQESFKIIQTAGLPSGKFFPRGITTNSFQIIDQAGNVDSCSFDIELLEFESTNGTLACNDNVNVSLDQNCEGIITADMVVEGNNIGCYEDYIVVIKDQYGNEYGNIITSDLIDKDLIVEVTDEENNTCWGKIVIEDKLGPVLECSTRVTQCTQETTPGAELSDLMRFSVEPDALIPPGDPSELEIPIDIIGLDMATIVDVNVELLIEHTFVSDLSVVLVSPEGTEVSLLVQPGITCGGNNLDVTLNDQSALLYDDLNASCDPINIPAISGEYRPFENLSLFNGEDPNGTWILRVSDFAFGDGGYVRKATIELTQENGIVGLPIPETASFTDYGNKTFLVIGLDPCGPTILTYYDDVDKQDCSSPYTEIIYRTYTAEDESGNIAMECVDTINVLRTDLGTLQFPPDYDGMELPYLSCTSPYPDPAVTGEPTGDFCDNVQITYEDLILDICENSYKVLRTWKVLEWCTSAIVEHTQIIKVVDDQGPDIVCPQLYQPISTEPNSCLGGLLLPPPTVTDSCSENPTYTVSSSEGTITLTPQGGYYLSDLPPGIHTVTYTATDDCSNTSSCSFEIEVEDLVPPVAVCDKHTQVALTFEPEAEVLAFTFDDGSYDDCSNISWEVRRMTDNCEHPENLLFSESVTFCCDDIGMPLMVEMKVTDENGNFNTCMVEVVVVDKLAPAIQVPPNITLDCNEPYDDPELTGGYAIPYDNCDVDLVFEDVYIPLDCGEAVVYRYWTATDNSGNNTTELQIISLINNDPFTIEDITWPDDVVFTNCIGDTDPDNTGRPILENNVCSVISVTYEDDVFTSVGDACYQVLRTWTVIDDCQFNPNNPKYGIGWWKDIQVINIKNNNAPQFQSTCEDITVEVYGNCEGDVNLQENAIDDCTPEDQIVYTWRIDEFNTYDGIYEYEGTGNTINVVLEHGDHRVLWTASDQCGNISKCEYIFTVVDGKAPTPYCVSSLSTAVMNNNCLVEIWASDFDLGAFDNCTAMNDLIFSFEQDTSVQAITFTCDDIINGIGQVIDLEVWVTDKAGNQDYCSVQILVEDNEADCCNDSGTVMFEGSIKNMEGTPMEFISVLAEGIVSGVQKKSTDIDGNYAFDLMPGVVYDISASKNGDYLNGVTTLDIILIQKHILGVDKFNDPFNAIAGDTNNDGKISGSDIIQIRKLILGLNSQFSNEQLSWRMVKKDQVFPDPFKPFPYEEKITVTTTTQEDGEFVAVKIGDVNNNAIPNDLDGNKIDNRSNSTLVMNYPCLDFQAGEMVELQVSADDFRHMIGLQTTFTFDQEILDFVDVEEGAFKDQDFEISTNELEGGMLPFLWTEIEPLSTDEALFTLFFTAKANGSTDDILGMSSAITTSLAYDEKYSEYDISIECKTITSISNEERMSVSQNSPNPFKDETMIQFNLPSSDNVTFSVYNGNGQEIINSTERYPAGTSVIQIQNDLLGLPGVYYYKFDSSYGMFDGKMILIE